MTTNLDNEVQVEPIISTAVDAGLPPCRHCGDPICPGDAIRCAGWVHADCPTDDEGVEGSWPAAPPESA